MKSKREFGWSLCAAAMAGTLALATNFPGRVDAASSKPNILFFILDDVGIDQLKIFNPDSPLPPVTPNLALLAAKGIKFTNVWAMPECSPSRSAFFTGRYPLHSGVEAAIMENHLPQSYMSAFEATLPRVLAKAGYQSALFGKYHLGNEQDPAGLCAPSNRGWQTFSGAMTAGPPSIDMTAGGVDKTGSQVCGYFQTKAAGACYMAPGDSVRCMSIDQSNADPGTDPARTCLQRGGIFVPNAACKANGPKYSDFSRNNGYYVWPRTTLSGVRDPFFIADANCSATPDHRYLTEAQSNDGISWWNKQTGPRMLTVSYNAIHTPLQKAPTDIVPDPVDAASTCSSSAPPRTLLNNMLEGIDVEIGRALAGMGLGTLRANGRTLASLDLGNTVVVIIGDNGSQGPVTRFLSNSNPPKQIFDPTRAKTTVYQTGVWVPMIVAGPVVKGAGRSVNALINAVDLFQLFGDIAGINVAEVVPSSHPLDSQPMLPYLTSPATAPIRTTNFTQEGVAIFSPVPDERSWPCQIGNLCNDTLFNNKGFCEDNGGVWWGPGGKKQAKSCCAVGVATNQSLSIAPAHQYAVRNKNFKLVELHSSDCSAPITNASQKPFPWAEFQTKTTQEFYDIRSTGVNPKGVDFAKFNLAKNCAAGQDLTTCLPTNLDAQNYTALNKELQRVKNSAKAQNKCQAKGDGNQDMRVTQADIEGWQAFNGKGPSRYDINLDGVTDEADLKIIQANLGHDCLDICMRADLNRDGKVNSADLTLLSKQAGTCADDIFCGGDLNGDGKVDNVDVALLKSAQKTCK
jgi:arylsulfatase A-like enzyme